MYQSSGKYQTRNVNVCGVARNVCGVCLVVEYMFMYIQYVCVCVCMYAVVSAQVSNRGSPNLELEVQKV